MLLFNCRIILFGGAYCHKLSIWYTRYKLQIKMNDKIKSTTISKEKPRFSIKLKTNVAGIYFISCQCNNVQVELFFSKQQTTKTELDYIYVNRIRDNSGKWYSLLNELCQQQYVSLKYSVFIYITRNYLENA